MKKTKNQLSVLALLFFSLSAHGQRPGIQIQAFSDGAVLKGFLASTSFQMIIVILTAAIAGIAVVFLIGNLQLILRDSRVAATEVTTTKKPERKPSGRRFPLPSLSFSGPELESYLFDALSPSLVPVGHEPPHQDEAEKDRGEEEAQPARG